MPATLIVILCYNEAQRLGGAAFKDFADAHDDVDLLFVNDGSTDDPQARLEGLCNQMHQRNHVAEPVHSLHRLLDVRA